MDSTQMLSTVVPLFLMLVAAGSVSLPNSEYSVEFPGAPECTSTVMEALGESIPKRTCSLYLESPGRGFTAEYMVMPALTGKATANELLMGAASGSALHSGAKITSHRFHEVDGYPALDATFEPTEQGYIAFVRYALVGNHLIMLVSDGYHSNQRPSEVSTFLESLRIPAEAPNNSFKPTPLRGAA